MTKTINKINIKIKHRLYEMRRGVFWEGDQKMVGQRRRRDEKE